MLETTWFYAPPSAFRGDHVILPDGEAHHVSNVLRGGAGEEVVVVDGQAGWYRVRLDELDGNHVAGRVLEQQHGVGEPSYHLTIGIGVVKNRRRFETFVEKSVELGVSRIVPLATARTEKQRIRGDRIRRVLLAAMKQTRRSRLPDVDDVVSLDTVLTSDGRGKRLLCHDGGEAVEPLARHLEPAADREITVLIGPEGGFNSDEIAAAETAGWELVRLGSRRLRTETAGVAVAAGVHLLLDS